MICRFLEILEEPQRGVPQVALAPHSCAELEKPQAELVTPASSLQRAFCHERGDDAMRGCLGQCSPLGDLAERQSVGTILAEHLQDREGLGHDQDATVRRAFH